MEITQTGLFNFYVDRKKWGRVWKGYIPSDDNLHYAYCDGELNPEGRLVWTLATTAQPTNCILISEARAAALLIENRWPNLTTEGWEEEEATQIISDIFYNCQVLKQTK